MPALKIVAVVLIVAGILALVYGGFSYTQERHEVDIGPVEFAVEDKERVQIPVWAGIGAIAVGTALLLVRKR